MYCGCVHSHPNPNTAWANDWTTWILYVTAILGMRVLLQTLLWHVMSSGTIWSIVHITHFIVSFYLLHWAKGSAFYAASPEISLLTLWEQIDNETAFTPARKFMSIVPIVLFLFTWAANDYGTSFLNLVNWATFIVLFVAKLPITHRVRLFGINA